MSNYISTIDYNGNTVICSKQQWFGHIVSNHGIMKENKAAVVETIQSPDTVHESQGYENRKVFFKTTSSATYGKKFNTKVIVEYDENSSGEIVTAFPSKSTKGGIGNVVYSTDN